MIFVTVGNSLQGFRRLLDAVDDMAGEGIFGGEHVFVQSGNNPDFKPRYCEHKSFLRMDEFADTIEKANLVICHAGAGTLIHVLKGGKLPIVMPRRKMYREHIDDHQVELVKVLADKGKIIPAWEPADLREAADKAKQSTGKIKLYEPTRMLAVVKKAIKELIEGER